MKTLVIILALFAISINVYSANGKSSFLADAPAYETRTYGSTFAKEMYNESEEHNGPQIPAGGKVVLYIFSFMLTGMVVLSIFCLNHISNRRTYGFAACLVVGLLVLVMETFITKEIAINQMESLSHIEMCHLQKH